MIMDIQEIITVGGFFVLYTGFIFAGFSWMLRSQMGQVNAQIGQINTQMVQINTQIENIKVLLTNHVTDTDKKIESLRKEVKADLMDTNKKIDHLGARFDRLYDYLIQEKKSQ